MSIEVDGREGGSLGLSIVCFQPQASHFRNMFSRSSLKVEWKPLRSGRYPVEEPATIEQKLTDRNVTVEPHIQNGQRNW